jgi:hypothetical protein
MPTTAFSIGACIRCINSMNVLAYYSFTIIPPHGNCAQPIPPPHLHLKTGHSRVAPSLHQLPFKALALLSKSPKTGNAASTE